MHRIAVTGAGQLTDPPDPPSKAEAKQVAKTEHLVSDLDPRQRRVDPIHNELCRLRVLWAPDQDTGKK